MNTKTTVISQAELDAQFAFCDKIADYWHARGRTPGAYVETYGCQQNEADSEKLRGYLTQCGYAIVTEAEGADVVVMNTCAIRDHAEQRVFGNLGALTHTKRRHPEQKIFLCGCMAESRYLHADGSFLHRRGSRCAAHLCVHRCVHSRCGRSCTATRPFCGCRL